MQKILTLPKKPVQPMSHTLNVFVEKNGHCNLDSLPLRFGFYFDRNQLIQLEIIDQQEDAQRPDRFLVEAWIVNPDIDEKVSGVFVLTRHKEQGGHVLITAWRHDANTEHGLSDLMIGLRKSGKIDSEWLKANHRLYVAGELRTPESLIDHLAIHYSNKPESSFQEIAEDTKKKSKQREQEDARLTKAAEAAKGQGNDLLLSRAQKLVKVEEGVTYRGSKCTQLVMEDETSRYMKVATFDRGGVVTARAKSFEGMRVQLSCWDPKDEPGKWSSQGYFRDVYLVDSAPQ